MSLLIEFSPYEIMLRSEDENTVKAVLQKLFELLTEGYTIPRSKKEVFKELVRKHISSKSTKVRKWAYHCACYCSSPIDDLCRAIIIELQKENETENILWGLTALSLKYGSEELLKQCVGERHDEFVSKISKNYLFDALVLFGDTYDFDFNINRILDANNTADLATLTKIYGYPQLVLDRYPEVTQDVIRSLESHNDPYIREYAFWAQALTASKGNYIVLPDDPDDNVQKHLVTLQLKNGNEDFICSVLKSTSLRLEKVSLPIKIGIMRGLSEVTYNSRYVPFINSWFAKETTEPIVLMLLDYVLFNCRFNREEGTFFDIIKDALEDSTLSPYISKKIGQKNKYDLVLRDTGNSMQLDFISRGETIVESITLNVNGTSNNVALATESSAATVTSVGGSDQSRLDELIQAVRSSAEAELSEEQLAKVNEKLNSILGYVQQQKQPDRTILDVLLESLKTLSNGVKFTTAVANLIDFFDPKTKTLR